jgi:hypothetical protein
MRPRRRMAVSYWTEARFDKRACPDGAAFSLRELRIAFDVSLRNGEILHVVDPASDLEIGTIQEYAAAASGCNGDCWGRWWGQLTVTGATAKKCQGQLSTFDISRRAGIRSRPAVSLPCLELCPARSPSRSYLLSGGSRKCSRSPGGPPSDEFAERCNRILQPLQFLLGPPPLLLQLLEYAL